MPQTGCRHSLLCILPVGTQGIRHCLVPCYLPVFPDGVPGLCIVPQLLYAAAPPVAMVDTAQLSIAKMPVAAIPMPAFSHLLAGFTRVQLGDIKVCLLMLQQEIAEFVGPLPVLFGVAKAPDRYISTACLHVLYITAHMKVDGSRMAPVACGRPAFEVAPCKRAISFPVKYLLRACLRKRATDQ